MPKNVIMLEFLSTHQNRILEIIGVITSLLYLYFSVRESIWLWLFGLISSAVYVWVFYQASLYADAGLYVYYVLISVYGWLHWYRGSSKTQEADDLQITRTSQRDGAVYALTALLLFAGMAWGLHFTDSDVPYGDAFTTSLSVVATYMLARKKLEQWMIWIVVDAFAMGLYLYKAMYPTAGLFLVYTVLAIWGHFRWKKHMQHQQYAAAGA